MAKAVSKLFTEDGDQSMTLPGSIEDLLEKAPLPQTNCNTRYFGTTKKLECSFTTYQKSDKIGSGKILEILI